MIRFYHGLRLHVEPLSEKYKYNVLQNHNHSVLLFKKYEFFASQSESIPKIYPEPFL